MRILNFSFCLLLFLAVGCTGEASTDQATTTKTTAKKPQNEPMQNATPIASKTNVAGKTKLVKGVNPCDYMSAAVIKQYFDTKEERIIVKESSIESEFSKNCMAIWSTGENVSERLVDGYKHVAPAVSTKFKYRLGEKEAAGWANDEIAKLVRKGGSKLAEHDASFHYVPVEKVGDAACWSREKSHLVWRRDNDLLEVFVNIPMTENKRKAYAMALALELNSQF